jgi:hypothetical protein
MRADMPPIMPMSALIWVMRVIPLVMPGYERQRLKVVTTAEGRVREVAPGELPEPTENLLVYVAGEPQFTIRLATSVTSDEEVPDELAWPCAG